ncbi:hypothetical protein [Rosistilla oblonga]|uniref:Uncharacterized protein n=1 Tax=Rosistilla oblonga TaxID=2527990 RepID=A0A518IXG7_9BACT|nr:hypothetical protein [Rosistilla oblonga]QDV57768.1 hypothetical protein Mal33_37820 [Rosistilla oblonga]
MPNPIPKQDAYELEVFSQFVSFADIPIATETIFKREPPEPDILCDHENCGQLGFELVQLVPQTYKHRLGLREIAQNAMQQSYEHMNERQKKQFSEKFRNATIHILLEPSATKGAVHRNTPQLLKELLDISISHEGELEELLSTKVRSTFDFVFVQISDTDSLKFSVGDFGHLDHAMLQSLKNKMCKTYSSGYPIDLLAYVEDASYFPQSIWKEALDSYLKELDNTGPFQRIWLADIPKRCVICTYPSA